ncbi:MAG: hypothetical protein SFY81_08100 [Verrucomicrobiota bacterium]|nr:hypothetical protein [Verrucomicrobiota bacterium]
MKSVITVIFSVLASLPLLAQPAPIYVNNGTATNVNVDAEVFVNNGLFSILSSSTVPFDTQNTRIFTNNGLMQANIGFELDTVDPETGMRTPAQRFINTQIGVLESLDSFGSILRTGGDSGAFLVNTFQSQFSGVRINADTLENQGTIAVGPAGLIRLRGNNVVLRDSKIVVDRVGSARAGTFGGFFFDCDPGLYSFFLSESNFFPETGVYDLFWGMGTETNLVLPFLLQDLSPSVVSPSHPVTNALGGFRQIVQIQNGVGFILTNLVNGTNVIRQAVFVQTSDPRVFPDVRFLPLTFPNGDLPNNNGFLTPVIELAAVLTNAITEEPELNTLYIVDQLAEGTNFNVIPNVLYAGFRPATYVIARSKPCVYDFGFEANALLTPTFFFDPSMSNIVITNASYAAYAAEIDSMAQRVQPVPGLSVTNFPGRVEIVATNLDLTRTRIRGEGLVSINTDNLLGNSNSVIDVENVSFALGSTDNNRPLRVENLTRETVERLNGAIQLWSSAWTNQTGQIVTNVVNGTNTLVTNIINVAYHITLVDAAGLITFKPVVIDRFTARAENIFLRNNMSISNIFELRGENVTIDSDITLSTSAWGRTNVPTLKSLTITEEGFLAIRGLGDFGYQDGIRYTNFVNDGTMTAFSHLINSSYFENRGDIRSGQAETLIFSNRFGFFITNAFIPSIGPIRINAEVGKIEDGIFTTGGDVELAGNVLKFSNHRILAGGAINIDVTGSIQDLELAAPNIWRSSNGFNMTRVAPLGTLLGTRIESAGRKFFTSHHTWAAPDVGPLPGAFRTNTPIGHLILGGEEQARYAFHGAGPNRAIYVDLLQITGWLAQSTNLTGNLRITNIYQGLTLDANIDIYYADLVSTNPGVTAEILNGRQFGNGRLIWVPEAVGPNSSVDVARLDGTSQRLNRSLRESRIIDSDQDGIANGLDDFPLDNQLTELRLLSVAFEETSAGTTALVTFSASPSITYILQYTDNLQLNGGTLWHNVTTYTHSGGQRQAVTLPHSLQSSSSGRYYRVKVAP